MSHRRYCKRILPLLLLVALNCTPALGDDWPQWFGPQRDGVWHETDTLERFPDSGPKIIWRVPVNPGYSGPAVAAGRVYLSDRIVPEDAEKPNPQGISKQAGKERVFCLDARSGEQLWEHTYDCEYEISYPEGPRTTPLVDEDRVYHLGAMGHLQCLDAGKGDIVWSKNLMQEYEFQRPLIWGWSASPMLDGDRLICMVGGKDAGVVAFDKRTGKEVWKAIDAQEIGYAPPALYEGKHSRQLIVWHDVAVQALDPETGKRLWRVDFPEDGEVMRPAATIIHPRVFGDRVLVSDFYNGSLVLQVNDAEPDAEVVWASEKDIGGHKDSLNTLMCAPVAKDGHLYGIGGNGELRCLDAETGEVVWRDLAPIGGKAAIFATVFIVPNGDRFVLATDQGELILANLSESGYDEIDRAKILEPVGFARGRNVVWSHPAFANKRVFWRNDEELICVDVAGQPR